MIRYALFEKPAVCDCVLATIKVGFKTRKRSTVAQKYRHSRIVEGCCGNRHGSNSVGSGVTVPHTAIHWPGASSVIEVGECTGGIRRVFKGETRDSC